MSLLIVKVKITKYHFLVYIYLNQNHPLSESFSLELLCPRKTLPQMLEGILLLLSKGFIVFPPTLNQQYASNLVL